MVDLGLALVYMVVAVCGITVGFEMAEDGHRLLGIVVVSMGVALAVVVVSVALGVMIEGV